MASFKILLVMTGFACCTIKAQFGGFSREDYSNSTATDLPQELVQPTPTVKDTLTREVEGSGKGEVSKRNKGKRETSTENKNETELNRNRGHSPMLKEFNSTNKEVQDAEISGKNPTSKPILQSTNVGASIGADEQTSGVLGKSNQAAASVTQSSVDSYKNDGFKMNKDVRNIIAGEVKKQLWVNEQTNLDERRHRNAEKSGKNPTSKQILQPTNVGASIGADEQTSGVLGKSHQARVLGTQSPVDNYKNDGFKMNKEVRNIIAEEVKKQLSWENEATNLNERKHLITSSKSADYSRHATIIQGRQADNPPCDENMDSNDKVELYKIKVKPKLEPNLEVQGAESNILPQVKNTTETIDSNTTETVKKNKTVSATADQNYTTIRYSNTSTVKPAIKNNWNKKLKTLLNFIGPAVGVFTIVGGASYMLYSVM